MPSMTPAEPPDMSGHAHATHACCGNKQAPAAARTGGADGKAIDPVCGMRVDPAKTPHRATHEGSEYHFCNPRCREKFLADPERYLHPQAAEPLPPPPPGTRYFCPMDPQ